ncbi:hypothetical protein [uncultured Microbacterium sp.]|uniref:hypothetical protein n=1 Tax=uncultured Microbacterium sp. TaxID=191216 RepID=UPI0028DD3C32|nr:hypothetical protein [uncultured Microbacterium sp.]
MFGKKQKATTTPEEVVEVLDAIAPWLEAYAWSDNGFVVQTPHVMNRVWEPRDDLWWSGDLYQVGEEDWETSDWVQSGVGRTDSAAAIALYVLAYAWEGLFFELTDRGDKPAFAWLLKTSEVFLGAMQGDFPVPLDRNELMLAAHFHQETQARLAASTN